MTNYQQAKAHNQAKKAIKAASKARRNHVSRGTLVESRGFSGAVTYSSYTPKSNKGATI